MASNRDESHPPPRKSRRLASRSTIESVQTLLAGNVQNSVQSQFNELLIAAIPTITQSVVTALQQTGIISNTIQTQSDPQCRTQEW
jgi:acetylglutamate kinase